MRPGHALLYLGELCCSPAGLHLPELADSELNLASPGKLSQAGRQKVGKHMTHVCPDAHQSDLTLASNREACLRSPFE